MSPDLERLLRAAQGTLPEPDDEVGRRARAAVVASIGRRRPRGRTAVALAAALAAATGVGFGFGQLLGPGQGQAAQPGGVFGAGFLPADGWSTFQRGGPRGAAAVAANVPLRGDDLAREDLLPVATLGTLPRRGTVIVAALATNGHASTSAASRLPLRLEDGNAEVRRMAGRALLVRELRARVGAYVLRVSVYFGARAPSEAVVVQAQRELERLVVEAPKVTIRVERRQRGFISWVEVRGTIASSAAGQVVEVEHRECGRRGALYHLIGSARTAAGGSWELQTLRDGAPIGGIPSNGYFRASWDGTFSEPALARIPIWTEVSFNRRTRIATARVSSREIRQSLRGRWVELQRKVPATDQWVRIARARLRRASAPFGPYLYQARFRVRARGLTLRSFVPAETGAPCYSAGSSPPFTS